MQMSFGNENNEVLALLLQVQAEKIALMVSSTKLVVGLLR
jgi:hypothetical protein